MKTDNALRKALLRKSDELPYGFDSKVMRQILLEAELKGRRSYYRSLTLVAFVSLALIAGMLYVLATYFNINILNFIADFQLPSMDSATILTDRTRFIIAFSIYIGCLMLFLLGMDYFFRQRFRKKKNH